MKLVDSIWLLGSFASADSRIRLEHGYYGRLIVKTERPDSQTTLASVCSKDKSPISKKFASTLCLNINSELDSFSWENTTDPFAKGFPLIQEKDLFCKDETDFSTCFHNFKSSDCLDHQNDVVITCQKPTAYDKSVQWTQWSAWDSDNYFFKWRLRNCTSELRTFNDDIVSCSLKFPGEHWFYGESLSPTIDHMNGSSFDDIPGDILYMDDSTDDEDWLSESSGDDSAQRKRLRSSASLLTLSISFSFFLFLSF